MTGQPNMLEWKQKQYHIATATTEEHAPALRIGLPPLFFYVKRSGPLEQRRSSRYRGEVHAPWHKHSVPQSFQPMHSSKTFRQYKTTTKKKKKKQKSEKWRREKSVKYQRLHGSTFRYWEFLIVAERSSWLRWCRYISPSVQGFKKKNSTMLHLYLNIKIANQPLGGGLVYILGRGYDSWVIRLNAVCLYWHWMKTVELVACIVCP